MSRVYIGTRLAIGRNASRDKARPIPTPLLDRLLRFVSRAMRGRLLMPGEVEVYQPRGPAPGAGNCRDLDIERLFAIMTLKEARVTKHDADRKVKILDYIAATLRARGYPPSVREIARAVGLASTSAVHHHLQILEREGYLERGAAQSRAIRLTPTAAIRLGLTSELVPQATTGDARVVPIIGEIAAGGPIEAYQDATETMAIPDVLAPGGDAYVLRVRGDSMIEAHIADGDFVLIRPQTTARNGDIVVAQVEENAVTLKRFFKEKDQIRLQPANEAYPPQFYDDVRIQGKLIGVIRRLD
jgi:repressor LexA